MPGSSRSLSAALRWAESQVGDYGWRRLCLGFVRQAWGIAPSVIPTAAAGYRMTKHRHPGDRTAPPGALGWFDGPTSADHVVMFKGNGKVYSNDVISPGRIDITTIGRIEDEWDCRYLGWTEDYPGFGRLPLDLVGEKPESTDYKIGQRVIVSSDAGLKARSGPGTESSTLIYRNGKLLTVAKGYRIKITKIAREDGYIWLKADRYWYGTPESGRQFVRKV